MCLAVLAGFPINIMPWAVKGSPVGSQGCAETAPSYMNIKYIYIIMIGFRSVF